ncbi:Sphingosine-1-phosphate lyase 1 [Phytophthora pseudosyringae]|uniref:sphinganine-1-phosphate aldolase n=1 Tax=Phytophthora pseudosyringae TaxID=221518 RepID=A0A8T1WLB7_9STRA|nr:Sphingosine-1-phosphate lyase 1 [Phytophthora pseudosyringae]
MAPSLAELLPIDEERLPAYAIAVLVLYLSLRPLFNVDRALVKLWPSLLLLFAYYRYRLAVALPTALPSSFLLQLWTEAQQRVPVVEAVFSDTLLLVLAVAGFSSAAESVRRVRYVSRKNLLNVVGGAVLDALKQLPIVSSKVADEMRKIEGEVEHSLKGKDPLAAKMEKLRALPDKGMDDEKLLALMEDLAGNSDDKWKDGLVSGAVYHGEKEHLDVLNKAYALFAVTNPLHADLWPAVNKFEAEVIAMTAGLMNGGHPEVCGTLSSGGTESIFLATKTHREYYRRKHGIAKPEIIACVTAHAAIDKACEVLGIKLIKVPMDPKTLKVDLDAVRWSISANTIMLYSSAPNFPHGMIDDIEALSRLAVKNDVGLHVDCCLGGFVLPFARQLGRDIPVFDFSLPGVTSISCDTHKYGYGSKGTSVVLYKNPEMRRFQYFSYADWTGGLYATPTLAGSRPGALSAAAWASMVRLGREGYLEKTKGILDTVDDIKAGIQRIGGIHLLGDPKAMVVSFAGDKGVNALKVSDAMAKHGWSLSPLQHPTSVHLCVTVRHIGKAKKFLRALEEAVNEVKQDPNPSPEGGSAIYGMASSLPAGPVDDILRIYTDITLKV